jgi:hypothetical protein
MKTNRSSTDRQGQSQQTRDPYHVRLPVFIHDRDVGIGDIITRATSIAGISPCGGCVRRAAALNKWIVLSPMREK